MMSMYRQKLITLLGSILLALVSLLVSGGSSTSAVQAATTISSTPAIAKAYTTCPSTLKKGSNGIWVRTLQMRINYLHHEYNLLFTISVKVDGQFGNATLKAVKQFQQEQGISSNSTVNGATWAKLGFCVPTSNTDNYPHDNANVVSTTPYASCPSTLRSGSSGLWVKALQSRLNFLYYHRNFYKFSSSVFPLTIDGKYGGKTITAVRNFQKTINFGKGKLTVDGVTGAHTWAKLALC